MVKFSGLLSVFGFVICDDDLEYLIICDDYKNLVTG